MRGVEAGLDEVLALGLGDERLELGGGEGVDEAGLGDDEEEDLGAGERRELVGLRGAGVSTRAERGGQGGCTFFMMPAFRLEKVMCRRDLSWMNLISILRLSRPGLSSSSSSSSAALGRGRLTPLLSRAPLPLSRSSGAVGELVWSLAVISAMLDKDRRSAGVSL